jgi:hypothetical protein
MPRWAPWLASSLLLPAFLASAQPTSNDAKVVQTRDAARVLAVHLAHTPPTSPFAEDLESYRVEYRVPSATAVAAESVTFESQSASGETVDRLLVTSKRVECASEDGGACFASEPIRLVIDAVDKEHGGPVRHEPVDRGVLGHVWLRITAALLPPKACTMTILPVPVVVRFTSPQMPAQLKKEKEPTVLL